MQSSISLHVGISDEVEVMVCNLLALGAWHVHVVTTTKIHETTPNAQHGISTTKCNVRKPINMWATDHTGLFTFLQQGAKTLFFHFKTCRPILARALPRLICASAGLMRLASTPPCVEPGLPAPGRWACRAICSSIVDTCLGTRPMPWLIGRSGRPSCLVLRIAPVS